MLDFGVARAVAGDAPLTQVTQPGELIGTLPYMSPEQASSQVDAIDIRSDVYALGLILYELLTGRLPYSVAEVGVNDAVRIICEQPPIPPGSLRRELRGDISTVVLKALQKDPEQRYASVTALSDDIQRIRTDQPVLARPPSTSYYVRKLIARHHVLFTVLVGAFLAVSTLAGWVGVLYFRASAAEQKALDKAATATRVKHFMEEVFLANEPDQAQGREISARELLQRGLRRIDDELVDEPVVRAELLTTICKVLVSHGEHQTVLDALEKAHPEHVRVLGAAHPVTRDSVRILAQAYAGLSQWPKAEALLREGLRIIEADPAHSPEELAETLAQMGSVVRHESPADAERFHRRALALRRSVHGDLHDSVASSLIDLGVAVRSQNQEGSTGARLKEAEGHFREALSIALELFGEDRLITAHAYTSLGVALKSQQRLGEAEENYLAGLRIYERLLNEQHPYVANSLKSLAANQIWQGQFEDAERHLERALQITRAQSGDHVVEIGNIAWQLGILYRQHLGNPAAAEPLHREALAVFSEVYERTHPQVERGHVHLGLTLLALHQYEEALMHYRAAKRLCEERGREDCAKYNCQTASCLRNLGRVSEAAELMREALEYADAANRRPEIRTEYEVEIARCLIDLGEFAEAEKMATSAYERVSEMLSEPDLYFLLVNRYRGKLDGALEALATVCESTSRPEDAVAWTEELADLRALPPATPPVPTRESVGD